MRDRVLLFGGTSEGRELAERLKGLGQKTLVCVATDYGHEILKGLESREGLFEVAQGRLGQDEMEELMRMRDVGLVIDATHPYAGEATGNIRRAAAACGIPLLRCLRPAKGPKGDRVFGSASEAAGWLSQQQGNVLLTTGSKELAAFSAMEGFRERAYARVLPVIPSLQACLDAGLSGRHIIAMQGPFSAETNCSQLREFGCSYLVTKDTGDKGGYMEKLEGARQAGALSLVIGRPEEETGMTQEQVMEAYRKWRDQRA